ncbi:RAI1 like PD-XK nuclease-domain-containing protein [Apiosordaria backusii]|uniref:Decapping nuclease n=1 Tax=Apiosordaria backusii TaxID=314023 RepID=A0AA40BT16_9PEZI|nr:RAI1 like PD-XK nuclease-domain-containing protein [Apiosordaria backusii]
MRPPGRNIATLADRIINTHIPKMAQNNNEIPRFFIDVNRLTAATTQAPVKRPREFACFSYDKNHNLRLDDSSLKWYYPPQAHELPANLSTGFDKFDKHDNSQDEHLDSLLTTIAHHEQQTGEAIDAKFVTWRGMMTKLMGAPYDEDGFEMNATIFQDCIFIEENWDFKATREAEQHGSWKGPISSQQMQFWGYKFETLATIPRPWGETSREEIENRDKEIVNNKEQYCSVVRSELGGKVLCLGGEVDAIWDYKPKTPGAKIDWVELKTSKVTQSNRDQFNFNRKLMKFWAQSFLLGVPRIIVGFRDKDGMLLNIEEYSTQKIDEQVRREHNSGNWAWRPWVCINFASEVLDCKLFSFRFNLLTEKLTRNSQGIQQTIRADPQQTGVWRIRLQKRPKAIELFKVEETGHGKIVTEEFVNWRTKLAASKQS